MTMRSGPIVAVFVVLALLVAAPTASAYLYWTDFGPFFGGGGTMLGRANLDGSGLRLPFIGGGSGPFGVATDGTYVYWTNSSSGGNTIGRANLDGSGVNQNFITGAVAAGGHPGQLAIQGQYIYWTDANRYVGRANLDGTNVNPTFINTGSGSAPGGLAVTSDTIYVGQQPNEITKYPIIGGSGTVVANDASWTLPPLGLAVSSGYIYYGGTGGYVGRVPSSAIDSTTPDNSFIGGLKFPIGVATDGTYVYWADNTGNAIGRAQIAAPSNRQDSFVSDPNGPLGLALDSVVDPTTTTVSCTPPSVTPAATTSCKATVTDSASSAAPTGLVVFTGNATTPFIGNASSCTLGPDPSGGASCVVGAIPQAAGTAPITATYQGDPVHAKSSGTTSVCVGSASDCGTAAPPVPPVTTTTIAAKPCKVPKLAGKTLAKSKKLLKSAHCALGKVSRPKSLRGVKASKLVVGRQRPKAGTRLKTGAKVGVTLARPARHH